MSRYRAHNPASRWVMCDACQHRGYFTRGDARAVKKNHHGEKGLTVFSCPHNEGMFHVGHRPEALTAGIIDRDHLRSQALGLVSSGNVENIWAQEGPAAFDAGAFPAFTQREAPQNGSTATQVEERQVRQSKVVSIISGRESGYSSRVDAAIAEMLDRRMESARDEYELRCLPSGSRFKVPAIDQHGKRVDEKLVGRTGTVLDVQPWPVTARNGDLLEVVHTVEFDDHQGSHSLSDLRMTVSAGLRR